MVNERYVWVAVIALLVLLSVYSIEYVSTSHDLESHELVIHELCGPYEDITPEFTLWTIGDIQETTENLDIEYLLLIQDRNNINADDVIQVGDLVHYATVQRWENLAAYHIRDFKAIVGNHEWLRCEGDCLDLFTKYTGSEMYHEWHVGNIHIFAFSNDCGYGCYNTTAAESFLTTYDNETVIFITHHPPVDKRAYEYLHHLQPDIWVFGHMHCPANDMNICGNIHRNRDIICYRSGKTWYMNVGSVRNNESYLMDIGTEKITFLPRAHDIQQWMPEYGFTIKYGD